MFRHVFGGVFPACKDQELVNFVTCSHPRQPSPGLPAQRNHATIHHTPSQPYRRAHLQGYGHEEEDDNEEGHGLARSSSRQQKRRISDDSDGTANSKEDCVIG